MGLAVTVLAVLLDPASLGPKTPAVRAATETAVSLIGLLACFLLLGRFVVSRVLSDLLLIGALLILVLANASFGILPTLVDEDAGTVSLWAHVSGRLLAALCLAVAAFVPPVPVPSGRRAVALMVLACLSGLLAVGVGAVLSVPRGTATGDGAGMQWQSAFIAVQLVTAMAFATAGTGLALRAIRSHDELLGWLSAAVVLATFASLSYALLPFSYGQAIHVGDVLRLGFYLALLTGGLREVNTYRKRAIAAAQLEERERIARNLHDGLTQDLAFLAGRLRDIAGRSGGGEGDVGALELASKAAQRALDEARAATASFAARPHASLAEAITDTAEEVASREGGHVRVSVESGVEVSGDVKEALVRIVREAVTNALRHGSQGRQRRRADDPPAERESPMTVEVSLTARDGLTLCVEDDGCGFDQERPGRRGIGSMRQRAAEHGGELTVSSTPGHGTIVAVRLPEEVLLRPIRANGHVEKRPHAAIN